jgi:hypothetical protein
VVPNAVLEMFYVPLGNFSLSLPDTMVTECIYFLSMEKNHLTVHVNNKYTSAKSILSTATKQLHLNLISKLILRFAFLLTKHNKERCHVKILIPYPCRRSSWYHCRHHLKLYLNTYSVPLCFDSAFTLFVEQSNSRDCVQCDSGTSKPSAPLY